MSGTLALVGGDPFSDVCTFNRELAEGAGADEVVVLPTAAAFEHPDRLTDAATAHFAAFGVGVRALRVLTRADAMDAANADVIAAARFVYLVGPAALHARSALKQTPAWDAIVTAWANGATIAGSDAGAQVLCDPMVDDRGGAFTVGLGLIDRVAVVPRHETWHADALHRLRQLSNADLVLIGVDTSTAVIRSPEGDWSAAGPGSVDVRLGGEPAELSGLSR
ncbi:MAG: Type 1 glutamine amidotransferase-like domain-containing protein [Actinobacteria bacterium]|nr:Type 1 glutamine amidotransferase-like domain-containing protein [Actinomycetota bacterium]